MSAGKSRPSGTGKSRLLVGLGMAGFGQGRRVRYATAAQLVNELVEAADERRPCIIARYGRLDLLCLDQLATSNSSDAAPSCASRSSPNEKRKPASPSPPSFPSQKWGTVIPDPRLVAAIVDRVTFNAHILETGTNSYRLRATRSRTRRNGS